MTWLPLRARAPRFARGARRLTGRIRAAHESLAVRIRPVSRRVSPAGTAGARAGTGSVAQATDAS
jgi:hypothetical protein